MKCSSFLLLVSAIGGKAYNTNNSPQTAPAQSTRRDVLATAAATASAALMGASNPRMAEADADVPTTLYFGVGVSAFVKPGMQKPATIRCPTILTSSLVCFQPFSTVFLAYSGESTEPMIMFASLALLFFWRPIGSIINFTLCLLPCRE